MYSDPIAYFLTWTCYGTWLPGDDRGSVSWQRGQLPPRPRLEDWCRGQMKSEAVILSDTERAIVEQTITEHAERRTWFLHTVNCRTNHCHSVITATDYKPKVVRDQLKSWCTRRLNEHQTQRCLSVPSRWWTKGGSQQLIFDEESLLEVIAYVRDAQDLGGSANS